MFDQLVLLASGGLCYSGPVSAALDYFGSIGYPAPSQINPAEYLLDLLNTDFSPPERHRGGGDRVGAIRAAWQAHAREAQREPSHLLTEGGDTRGRPKSIRSPYLLPVLLHRAWIKSHRDLVAYGVRVAMYLVSPVDRKHRLVFTDSWLSVPQALAIMMGTVWVRLEATEDSIQPFINALVRVFQIIAAAARWNSTADQIVRYLQFFGGAFTSFMAVSYVPAYLEDYQVFQKDRANGLYGPTEFMLANFLIGIPYLCP